MIATIRRFFKARPHAFWAFYFVIYLILFFLVESIDFAPESIHWMHHSLDDKIPFCEWFILFYYIWYPFLAIPGFHMLCCDGAAMRKYVWFVGLGFTLTLAFCVIYPNGQALRPDLALLGRENFLTRMVGAIYASDTNTNVCPSMHVIGSIGVFIATLDCEKLRKTVWTPVICGILAVGISASTVFCKQHSILDVFWGIVASAIMYVIVYLGLGRYADRLEAYQKRKAENAAQLVCDAEKLTD